MAARVAARPLTSRRPVLRPWWGASRPATTALRCAVNYHVHPTAPSFLDGDATPPAFVKPLQQPRPQPRVLPRVDQAPQLGARYSLLEEVGEGSFATVWRCVDRLTGAQLAAKALPKAAGGRSMLPAIQREVDCWSLLQGCRHVNPLLGVCQDAAAVYLLQPLCRGGDLELLLMDNGPLPERQAAGCLAVALAFLAHCRRLGVAFRDVKPANFLLLEPLPPTPTPASPAPPTAAATLGAAPSGCEAGARQAWPELRVVDFGTCRLATGGPGAAGGADRLEGTMLYMAPEVLQRGPAASGPAADVWSAGVMLFELLTGRFPFWGEATENLGQLPPSAIRCGILGAQVVWPGPGAGQLSREARHLISSLLHPDPTRRPTPDAALRHSWFLANCPPQAPPTAPNPSLASSIAPLTLLTPTPTSSPRSNPSPCRSTPPVPLPAPSNTTRSNPPQDSSSAPAVPVSSAPLPQA